MNNLLSRLVCSALCIVIYLMSYSQTYSYVRNIEYRTDVKSNDTQSTMCNLDIAFLPDANNKPVVVWFHGGGLTSGHKEIPSELLRDSIIVVGVEYRLSPQTPVDDIIDDAAAATAWVMNNIENYGGDRNRIFLSGHSAGGYLVDLVALDKTLLQKYSLDPDSLAGVIPFSGQCITHFEVRNLQGIHPLQPTIDEMAPLYHVRANCPPFLIISGDREQELYGRYEEQAYFYRMLKLLGNQDVTLYELDGFNHGDMCYPAFPLLLKFIRSH